MFIWLVTFILNMWSFCLHISNISLYLQNVYKHNVLILYHMIDYQKTKNLTLPIIFAPVWYFPHHFHLKQCFYYTKCFVIFSFNATVVAEVEILVRKPHPQRIATFFPIPQRSISMGANFINIRLLFVGRTCVKVITHCYEWINWKDYYLMYWQSS